MPRDYLLEATDWHRQPQAFASRRATPFFGYGYQFWTYPSEKRRFALLGVYGQSIFVDPELKLVMVVTAAAKNASVGKEPFAAERSALWRGLVGKIRKLVASGRQAHDIVQINRDHIQSDHTEEFPCEPWSSFS